jgi:hypothetical protein
VELSTDQAHRTRQTWALTGLLLLVSLGAWGLAQLPRAMAWPEQIALLGCFGLLAFGPAWGIPFLVLPVAWLGVRFYGLSRWGLARLHRAAPAAE